jgi:hypothetical protein
MRSEPRIRTPKLRTLELGSTRVAEAHGLRLPLEENVAVNNPGAVQDRDLHADRQLET